MLLLSKKCLRLHDFFLSTALCTKRTSFVSLSKESCSTEWNLKMNSSNLWDNLVLFAAEHVTCSDLQGFNFNQKIVYFHFRFMSYFY